MREFNEDIFGDGFDPENEEHCAAFEQFMATRCHHCLDMHPVFHLSDVTRFPAWTRHIKWFFPLAAPGERWGVLPVCDDCAAKVGNDHRLKIMCETIELDPMLLSRSLAVTMACPN
jgi:hypothetical protein